MNDLLRTAYVQRRQFLGGVASAIGLSLVPRVGHAASINRIVTVGGAITEIAFALGAGARIVAVDTTSLFPSRVITDLPKVGYLRMLSTEGLLSTKPDLILLDADAGPTDVLEQLQRIGTAIAHFTERPSAKSVIDKITFVGKALNEPAKAAEISQLYEADLTQVEQMVAALPQRPTALFLMDAGATGLRGAGAGTAAAQMIGLAGGRNAFGDATGYKPVSGESALAANPDVILMMSQAIDALGGVDSVAALPALAQLTAARQRRIIGMDGNYLLGFGPRTAHAVRDLAAALHPQSTIPVLPDRPWTIG
jgi:iron complex transport system substrate-binding protein